MSHHDTFRRALEDGDLELLRKAWAHLSPHLPQPASDEQARVIMHRARTEAASIALDKRAYSHAWLRDNGYPSGLPDELRPRAERLYPRVVEGVGIAVKSLSPHNQPAALIIRKAMSDAVEDAYADGRTEPGFIKARIAEAREKATRQLFGWSCIPQRG